MFVFTINRLRSFHKITMEHKMQRADNHSPTWSPYCNKHVRALSLQSNLLLTHTHTHIQKLTPKAMACAMPNFGTLRAHSGLK